MKFSTFAALLVSVVMAGCDYQAEPAGEILGPRVAAQGRNGDNGYKLAGKAKLESGTVSSVIGSRGGRLVLGRHELLVRAGSVDAPTVFTMTLVPNGHVEVDLTAVEGSVDVGSAGFDVPVRLTLSYDDAIDIGDPSLLRVVWAKPDGTFEEQVSTVDPSRKRVSANLRHFSKYILATPW